MKNHCGRCGDSAGCVVTFSGPCSIELPRYAVWLSHRNRTYQVVLTFDRSACNDGSPVGVIESAAAITVR